MSLDDFMRSFKDAWGVEVDRKPKTVRGLLELGEAALQDDSLMADLLGSAERLSNPLATTVDDCIRDLERHNNIDPGLIHHLEGVTDGFQSVLEGVEMLLEEPSNLSEALELLKAGFEQERLHQEGIELWQKQPACPLCGKRQRSERVCTECGVQVVIPDPNPPDLPAVTLGVSYAALRRAAGAVATGKEPVASLLDTSNTLATELLQLVNVLKQTPPEQLDSQPFFEVLEQAFGGIEQMRRFETTCAIADLNQGWATVSRCGVKLEQLRQSLI